MRYSPLSSMIFQFVKLNLGHIGFMLIIVTISSNEISELSIQIWFLTTPFMDLKYVMSWPDTSTLFNEKHSTSLGKLRKSLIETILNGSELL